MSQNRHTSITDIYEPVKELLFSCMDEVVCNRDDLILNPLFNFEPMKGLEYWGDVKMFGIAAGNGMRKCILDMLKVLNLNDE